MSETHAPRSCGGCTACCKTHDIEEIAKPARQWCKDCRIGSGCKIYEHRPDPCRTFTCAWLNGYGGSEDRPDKSRVVLEFGFFPHLEIRMGRACELIEGAFARHGMRQFFNDCLGQGAPLYLVSASGALRIMIMPQGMKLTPGLEVMREAGVAFITVGRV